MSVVCCPNCESKDLEHVKSVDLLECLNCRVIIWNQDILDVYKRALIFGDKIKPISGDR
jgi:hypothetical protein